MESAQSGGLGGFSPSPTAQIGEIRWAFPIPDPDIRFRETYELGSRLSSLCLWSRPNTFDSPARYSKNFLVSNGSPSNSTFSASTTRCRSRQDIIRGIALIRASFGGRCKSSPRRIFAYGSENACCTALAALIGSTGTVVRYFQIVRLGSLFPIHVTFDPCSPPTRITEISDHPPSPYSVSNRLTPAKTTTVTPNSGRQAPPEPLPPRRRGPSSGTGNGIGGGGARASTDGSGTTGSISTGGTYPTLSSPSGGAGGPGDGEDRDAGDAAPALWPSGGGRGGEAGAGRRRRRRTVPAGVTVTDVIPPRLR